MAGEQKDIAEIISIIHVVTIIMSILIMETTTIFLKYIDKISDDDDYEGHLYVRRNGKYLNKYIM